MLVFLAVACLAFATLPLWVSAFIYRPAKLSDIDPAHWRLPGAKSITIMSQGRRLSGWWIAPRDGERLVAMIVHGRSDNISTRAFIAGRLAEQGMGVLLFDYRGYGASEGRPSEQGLTEDSLAAFDWLRHQSPGKWRVAVVGQSLGNAPAARLAAARPVAALILVSPFTSLPDAAGDRLPYLPMRWLPWIRNRFDVSTSVSSLRMPVVLVASRSDGLVPFANSMRLAQRVRHPIWLVDDRFTHDGLLTGVVASGDLISLMDDWRTGRAQFGSDRACPLSSGVAPDVTRSR